MKKIKAKNIKTTDEAKKYLENIDLENHDIDKIDIIVKLTNYGLPNEAINRFDGLWDKTMTFGKETINVGKILCVKIIDFVEENPNMAAGAAVGIAIGVLTAQIPIVGHLLAPIVTALGITTCMVAGNRMDRKNKGEQVAGGFIGFMEDIISIAMKFLKLLIDAFNIIKNHYSDNLVIQPQTAL